MVSLYYQGGPVYMGILTLLALCVIALAIHVYVRSQPGSTDARIHLKHRLVRESGLLALIFGVFATSYGLYSAFTAISLAGSISTGLLAAGLKVALLPLMYGFVIFIIARLMSSFLSWRIQQPDPAV